VTLQTLPPTDTRSYFRPLGAELGRVLRELPDSGWNAPTVASRWRVRDVVAHLVDTPLRRLSLHRDRMALPPPPASIATDRDLVTFIDSLNASWVDAARRLSPRVLTDLYAVAVTQLADFLEALPMDAPALFEVSWAGEDQDAGWLDVGREFTEQFHHQMQIRDAVGAGPLPRAEWLHAVLLVAWRGLPRAFAAVAAPGGTMVRVVVTGPSGGEWGLLRDVDRWRVGVPHAASAADLTVTMSDDTAWRLLFHALDEREAAARIQAEGDERLLAPLLRARSVVV